MTIGRRLSWNIRLPGHRVQVGTDTRVAPFLDELTNRGFSLHIDENMRDSNLSIIGDRANSGTNVTCISYNETTPSVQSKSLTVRVAFYGESQ